MTSISVRCRDVAPALTPDASFNNCINCFEFIARGGIMGWAAEAAALPKSSSCGIRPIDRQEVTDNRFLGTDMVGQHLALQVGVGVGDPLVLAKMFSPRIPP